MYPILFQIKGFTFYTHGLLSVLGIIIGAIILYLLARKENLKNELLFDNIIYSVLTGIIGARLTYFFMYRDQFSGIKEIFYIWDGGMVSFGGFFLGGLAFYLLLRSQKEPITKWFDIISISFSLGLFLGRVGNIFAGEYAGLTTSSKYNLQGYIPINLYEGILLIIIFSALLAFYSKIKHKDGIIFSIFLISYGLGRFIIDIWRDESKLFLNISLGQLVSLLVALCGILLIYFLSRKTREVKHGIIS